MAPTGAPGRGGDGLDGAPRGRCGCAATAAAASTPRAWMCRHQSRRARPCCSARPGAYGEQQEGVTTHGTGHRLQRAARSLERAGRVLGSMQPSGWIEPRLGPTPGVHPGWRLLRDPKRTRPPLCPRYRLPRRRGRTPASTSTPAGCVTSKCGRRRCGAAKRVASE